MIAALIQYTALCGWFPMAAGLKELENELDQVLKPEQFNDYCPNGLQALGAYLANRFGLQHQIIDIDNPV